jgi:NAD-dependent deacetylase
MTHAASQDLTHQEDTPLVPPQVQRWARRAWQITVLTGAGMSAESGISTFRDAQVGLWERFDPMEIASIEGWESDPALVYGWYLWRVAVAHHAQPNAGHRALAKWSLRTSVRVVTQNVDDLHERAGSRDVVHLHGSLRSLRCSVCARRYDGPFTVPDQPVERVEPPRCGYCGERVRPGVVWFGELLPPGALDAAADLVRKSDLVIVVGTSGIVYPAALLPDLARGHGIPVVEINPGQSALSDRVNLSWRVTAAVGLPALVESLL